MKQATLAAAVLTVAVGTAGVACISNEPRSIESNGPISSVDIERVSPESAYDAVHRLRHRWLIPRSDQGGVLPHVFIEMACTEVTCLRWVQAHKVESIHLVGASDGGAARANLDEGEAIVVTLRMRAATPDKDGNHQ